VTAGLAYSLYRLHVRPSLCHTSASEVAVCDSRRYTMLYAFAFAFLPPQIKNPGKYFMVQNNDQFSVAAVQHADDPEGGVYEQSVLHRPADHLLHEGASAHGTRAPDADDTRPGQHRQRTADLESGPGEEPRGSDDARHEEGVYRNDPGRTDRQDAGCEGDEGDYEDGRGLGQDEGS